jgi:hypothetical protein
MKRLTVTLDDVVDDELQKQSEKCGISQPTLARLIVTYWTLGKQFQSPTSDELQDVA